MEIRVTIAPDGKTTIESISVLEDLWHDYLFFKSRAAELDQPSATLTDGLLLKRYYRAALLALVCYFEGVLNRWLEQLLAPAEWRQVERQCIEQKVELVQSLTPSVKGRAPDIGSAKKLRNTLVHLKPGVDGELYDRINRQLLDDTEGQVLSWFAAVETSTKLERHPDSRAASRTYSEALGTYVAEGYTREEE